MRRLPLGHNDLRRTAYPVLGVTGGRTSATEVFHEGQRCHQFTVWSVQMWTVFRCVVCVVFRCEQCSDVNSVCSVQMWAVCVVFRCEQCNCSAFETSYVLLALGAVFTEKNQLCDVVCCYGEKKRFCTLSWHKTKCVFQSKVRQGMSVQGMSVIIVIL